MEYMTLNEQGQSNMLIQRIGNLEAHHFGLKMNLAELQADESVNTGEPSPESAEAKQELLDQIAQLEARIAALKAMMPVVETPPATEEPPVEETPADVPVTEEGVSA